MRGASSPWRRFLLVVAFEAALVAVAWSVRRLGPMLLAVVAVVLVIEVLRLRRALSPRQRGARAAAGAAPRGIVGRDRASAAARRSVEARLATVDATATAGLPFGVLAPAGPDEFLPFVDIDPAEVPGYDWTVVLHDEVWLFADDDGVARREGVDPLELRLSAVAGVSAVLREDREIIYVAAARLDPVHLHDAAVDALADVSRVTAGFREDG